MELIPAIDLVGGQVVRLAQGDFDRQTTYDDDPVRVAQRWAGEGAARLHIVDLDGAREGRSVQGRLIRRIVASVRIPCQVAGGLRDETAVAAALAAGADRVVLGSALLRNRGWRPGSSRPTARSESWPPSTCVKGSRSALVG